MTDILQHPYLQAFARALVHFVWQGAAIGIVGYVLLRSLRLSASTRHTTGVALLALMLAAPLVTTWYLAKEAPVGGRTAVADAAAPIIDPAADARLVAVRPASVSPNSAVTQVAVPVVTPVVVLAIWLTGVVVLSIRLAGGWFAARRMARRAIQPASFEVQSLARRVAGRLALDRVVRIVESSRIAVPVMVGWIQPVVILPTAALAGLTPLQLEALLAHELAHIRRHDYLVNLLQSAVETVLFYHPAVWWVSAQVRSAREECCDDLAVGICDRLVYATALADLAAMAKVPRLALAAADGSLVDRVRRVLGHPIKPRDSRTAWLPIAIVAVVIGGWMPSAMTSAAADQSGVAAAVQAGVGSGVPGGVPDGVPGGVTNGVSGGVPSGVPGGVAGGIGGGVIGVVPRPVQEQATVAQPENAGAARYAMLAQLLEHARQLYDNARVQAQIGTMAGLDTRDAEATIARLEVEMEVAAKDRQRANAKALTEADAALVKQKFAEAIRRIENEETRFSVGVSSVTSVDEALLAAMEIVDKATANRSAGDVRTDQSTPDQAMTADALVFLRGQLEEARRRLAVEKEQLAAGVGSQSNVDTLAQLVQDLEAKLTASSKLLEVDQKLSAEKAYQDQYKAELAKVSVEEAANNLERVKKLADQSVASAQQVQEAEAALKRARIAFEASAVHLKVYDVQLNVAISTPAAALRDRILREGSTMADDALIGVLKDAGKLTGDTDRAEVLLSFALRQTMTPEMATLYVAAASGIKSDDERARVFRQPVRLRQGKGK